MCKQFDRFCHHGLFDLPVKTQAKPSQHITQSTTKLILSTKLRKGYSLFKLLAGFVSAADSAFEPIAAIATTTDPIPAPTNTQAETGT